MNYKLMSKPTATVMGYITSQRNTGKVRRVTLVNSDMFYQVRIPLDVDIRDAKYLKVTGFFKNKYDKDRQKTFVSVDAFGQYDNSEVRILKVRDRGMIYYESENLLHQNIKTYFIDVKKMTNN